MFNSVLKIFLNTADVAIVEHPDAILGLGNLSAYTKSLFTT